LVFIEAIVEIDPLPFWCTRYIIVQQYDNLFPVLWNCSCSWKGTRHLVLCR
jgi:hypothetical protein